MKISTNALFLLGLVAKPFATSAECTYNTYTVRSEWEAAVGSMITEDFSNEADTTAAVPSLTFASDITASTTEALKDDVEVLGIVDNKLKMRLGYPSGYTKVTIKLPYKIPAIGTDMTEVNMETAETNANIVVGGETFELAEYLTDSSDTGIHGFFGILVEEPECYFDSYDMVPNQVRDDLRVHTISFAEEKGREEATGYGDPHFLTWGGDLFDFHGGCDLVLLKNPSFANGLGMNIHVRTQIKTWWSHLKSVVVQVGDNSLEVMAGIGASYYWINGGDQVELRTGDASLGDFRVHLRRVNDHHIIAKIELGHGDAIIIRSFHEFIRVNFKDKSKTAFKGSVGLLGSYDKRGTKIGRDGKTVYHENTDDFGQEWMVRSTTDTLLFHDSSSISHAEDTPLVCTMPTVSKESSRRRLGQAGISREDAQLACSQVTKIHYEACISDVLATQDRDMANSY